jgi:hypothetical protein
MLGPFRTLRWKKKKKCHIVTKSVTLWQNRQIVTTHCDKNLFSSERDSKAWKHHHMTLEHVRTLQNAPLKKNKKVSHCDKKCHIVTNSSHCDKIVKLWQHIDKNLFSYERDSNAWKHHHMTLEHVRTLENAPLKKNKKVSHCDKFVTLWQNRQIVTTHCDKNLFSSERDSKAWKHHHMTLEHVRTLQNAPLKSVT